MTDKHITSDFFMAGGALPPDAPTYVERAADDELFNAVLQGQFCTVLADHHMGKSSLMFRTAWRLQQQHVRTVTFDLNAIGPDIELEQAYRVLTKRIKFELNLSVDPDTWWSEHKSTDTTQNFTLFLNEILLVQVTDPVVIFIDEINPTDFNQAFFASLTAIIQSLYQVQENKQLSFVLLGMSTLTDLVTDQNRHLFESGLVIDLSDFTQAEAAILQQGLPGTPDQQKNIFERINFWTQGHPYLTQKLCQATTKMWSSHWTQAQVDTLVENLFINPLTDEDPNLQFIINRINSSSKQRQLLGLYHQIYDGDEIPSTDLLPQQIKRLGLVTANNGSFTVRNQIYHETFNPDWIQANTPVRINRAIGIISLVAIILLIGGSFFFFQRYQQRVSQAQTFTASFKDAAAAQDRLANLAGLLNLGYTTQAQELFFDELTAEEQLALFDLADPLDIGEQLVTVVRGIYTAPQLDSNEQSNALLNAMAQSLKPLQSSPKLGSIEVELEITQWLKGRDLAYTQAQHKHALDAYNVAINMNGNNPGPYFDRGVANAVTGRTGQALEDFDRVLYLDERWETLIQQALVNNAQLYQALWGDQSEYGDLIALVPTPTQTPTPTLTPTASPTPSPTATLLPPTATPTATATPTVTPTPTRIVAVVQSTPTATPTPGRPSGTITLLTPDSIESPTYQNATFEWQWVGNMPPEFGFEVRVWKEGKIPAGVHNSVLDNKNGVIKNIGGNRYQLSMDINDATGIQGHSGLYLWTVALVRISPDYEDLNLQADPLQFVYAAPGVPDSGGSSSGGGRGGSSGGGGVGID